MGSPLKIVVADDDLGFCQFSQAVLATAGHQVAVARNGGHLTELCRTSQPDLVIAEVKLPQTDGIAAVAAIYKERAVPVILVSACSDTELVERAAAAPVLAYLVKPIRREHLISAIAIARRRFTEFEALQQEAAQIRQSLEERKIIEHAKGVVMKRLKLDEGEAFRQLQNKASDRNYKLIEMAREVLKAEEVFQSLARR